MVWFWFKTSLLLCKNFLLAGFSTCHPVTLSLEFSGVYFPEDLRLWSPRCCRVFLTGQPVTAPVKVLRGEGCPSISFRHTLPQHLLPSYLCHTGSCFVSAHWKFHYCNFRANCLSFSVLSCGSPSLSVVSSHWKYRALQTKTVFLGWTLDFSALQSFSFYLVMKDESIWATPTSSDTRLGSYIYEPTVFVTCTRPACMCIYKWYFCWISLFIHM